MRLLRCIGFSIALSLLVTLSAIADNTPRSESADSWGWGSYGAIAYSPSAGRHGLSWDWGTLWEAQNVALGNCGQWDCAIAVWARNACAVLAVPYYNRALYGWGVGGNYAIALQNAMMNCPGPCFLQAWICSF